MPGSDEELADPLERQLAESLGDGARALALPGTCHLGIHVLKREN